MTAQALAHPPRARRTGGRRLLSTLQLAPALLYFLAFFVGPFVVLLAISFFTFRDFNFYPDLTLKNYADVVVSDVFRTLYIRTVGLSLLSAVLSVGLAYAFVYILSFVFPGRRQLLYFLMLVSLFGGYLVRIYAWRTILGAEGVVNGTLMSLGVIQEPIRWILNSPFSVVVAIVNFLVPLAVLPIYAAMQNVSPNLLEAARDLGSSRADVNRRIVLPLVMPGVRVAFAFCLIASAGEFAIPALLGGTDTAFVGVQVQQQVNQNFNWPLGSAMALSLVVSVILIAAVLSWLSRFIDR